MSLKFELYEPKKITKSMIDEQFDQKNMKRDMSQYSKDDGGESRDNDLYKSKPEFERAVTNLRISERFIHHAQIGGRENINRMIK